MLSIELFVSNLIQHLPRWSLRYEKYCNKTSPKYASLCHVIKAAAPFIFNSALYHVIKCKASVGSLKTSEPICRAYAGEMSFNYVIQSLQFCQPEKKIGRSFGPVFTRGAFCQSGHNARNSLNLELVHFFQRQLKNTFDRISLIAQSLMWPNAFRQPQKPALCLLT